MASALTTPPVSGALETLSPRRPASPSPWFLLLPLGLALALLPPTMTAGLAFGVGGVVALLARPRWALYALAVTVPYQALVEAKVSGVGISVTEGVVAVLLIGWATRLASGRCPRPPDLPLLRAIAALLVTFALTVFVATNLSLSGKEMLKWVELAAVYVAGVSLLETAAHRRTLLLWLLAAAFSQALVGLVQALRRIGPDHFMIGGVLMRAYGTFEQPNPFAGYLGLFLPILAALCIFGIESHLWRRVAGTVAAAVTAAFVLTLSRGAWTGQVAALVLVVMAGIKAARRAVISLGALLILGAAVVWPLLPTELSGRLTSIVTTAFDLGSLNDAPVTQENFGVMERYAQWYAGWQMFRNNPLLGVGIGNYNAAYDDYRLERASVALGHAHNHYLTVAAEAGALGLLVYIVFLVTAFHSTIAAWRGAQDALGRALAIGILGSLAAFATHNLFDVLFVHGIGVTLGLLLALVHGVPRGVGAANSI